MPTEDAIKPLGPIVRELEDAHIRYLEATYHLSHPGLVDERRILLNHPGVVMSEPWIEAPPRYQHSTRRYEELSFPIPGLAPLLGSIVPPKFNPPYGHQARGLEAFLTRGNELVVATGTGSGKTEIFLYSILGHLLAEKERGRTVNMRSCRALVLYPMNALVSDQLARIRRLFGAEPSVTHIRRAFGRPIQFAMYTGRTPYHGLYNPEKNNERVGRALRKLEQLRGSSIFADLEARGRVPAKNIPEFIRLRGQNNWRRFRTSPTDAELYTRQEVISPRQPTTPGAEDYNEHGGTPDILITNYSMLEYTLLRPIEQSIWDDVRTWLHADEANTLLIVLDEAHLYRGAQGTEISLLLSRFANHLQVSREKLRFILTSASVGTGAGGDDDARRFAASLTNGNANRFEIIRGDMLPSSEGRPLPASLLQPLASWTTPNDRETARQVSRAWGLGPGNAERPSRILGEAIRSSPWYNDLLTHLGGSASRISHLGQRLWPGTPHDQAARAAENLISAITWSTIGDRDEPLLPLRLHLLVRGVQGFFACLNPECMSKRTTLPSPLGALYPSALGECACGGRVFELWSHRACGAAYIHAYEATYPEPGRPTFLWANEQTVDEDLGQLRDVVLLVEPPNHPDHSGSPPRYLGVTSGLLAEAPDDLAGEQSIPVWSAPQPGSNLYVTCPACGQSARPGGTEVGQRQPFGNIMDLQTKGEAPFANLVRALFEQQPPAWTRQEALERRLPNRGRKVLCFSDSRQKAARLARDLQRTVERDSFREIISLALRNANESLGPGASFDNYYAWVYEIAATHELSLFDTRGRYEFAAAVDGFKFLRTSHDLDTIVREHMDQVRDGIPLLLHSAMLRSISDTHYSLQATMVATPECHEVILNQISNYMQGRGHTERASIDGLIRDLLLRCLDSASVNPQIPAEARRRIGPKFEQKDDEDFGIALNDIFPRRLLETDDALTPGLLEDLSSAVRASTLLTPGPNGRYFLNAKRFRLRLLSENEPWGRCTVCSRPTPLTLGLVCPWKQCKGPVQEVETTYGPLSARKDLFRIPALEVARGQRRPYTLRAEEHTAQLDAYNGGELHSRAERYELLFQDILVDSDDDARPRAIDVLSCTTTMEVGIDIGSITAVALRTVPPRPDNYQQRAGRAGRRGSPISTILTFADLSPYEQFVFENPERILIPAPLAPILHTSNENIIQRHIYAALFQAFFFRTLPGGVTWRQRLSSNAQLFESLGTMEAFFRPPVAHDHDFQAFRSWLGAEILTGSSGVKGEIASIIPHNPAPSPLASPAAFVESAARALEAKLLEMSNQDMRHPDAEPITFLEALIRANLRPAFGFPLDLATFSVRGKLLQTDPPNKIQYEPQQDLQVALTEYAPGRELVIDKNDFLSYGLYVAFPQDQVRRAESVPWDELRALVQCEDCDSVLAFDVTNPNVMMCQACGSGTVRTYRYHRPDGFAPAVQNREWLVRRAFPEQEPVAAVAAKLPTPDLQDTASVATGPPITVGPQATLVHARNQRLVVSNLGQDAEGYGVCRECGAINPEAGREHYRPYPVPPWIRGATARCGCQQVARDIAFAHGFRTDIAMLRIVCDESIDYHPSSEWFQASAVSLAEALGIAATRRLRLERGELRAGWRPLQRDTSTSVERIIDIYLYDGTPGGAGFASRASANIQTVLADAAAILGGCTCERACNRCILTFDNRYKVKLLDRHAGLSLLGYVTTGTVPDVPAQEQARLAGRLERLLRRHDAGNHCAWDGTRWRVRVGSNQLPLEMRPVLRQEATNSGDVISYTDFQLRANPVAMADQTLQYRG